MDTMGDGSPAKTAGPGKSLAQFILQCAFENNKGLHNFRWTDGVRGKKYFGRAKNQAYLLERINYTALQNRTLDCTYPESIVMKNDDPMSPNGIATARAECSTMPS